MSCCLSKKMTLVLALCLTVSPAWAKEKSNKKAAAKAPAKTLKMSAAVNPSLNKKFQQIMELFRKGELQKKSMWDALRPFEQSYEELSPENQLGYQQIRAQLLFLAGYPLLATESASKALQLSPDPYAENHQPLWKILWLVSKAKPAQYIMEELAGKLGMLEGLPPEYGNNWNYVLGNAFAELGKPELAKAAFEKVVMQDRYFLSTQYQLAILAIQQNKPKDAEPYLKAILNPTAQDLADLRPIEIAEMINYAHMALGRLYYQEARFLEAAAEYRTIRRNSKLFYDSLFEQSWALFMAGSMKHGLGTIYSVHSPYFKNRFNPEAKVLESMIYYWICRYDEARNALADFSEQHREAIESLSTFLDRQRLSPDTAYQLFENLITGVSGASIGIPTSVLATAAESDSMMLIRDQYASLVEEMTALDTYGIYGNIEDAARYKQVLLTRSASIRSEIGSRFLAELRNLKDHFDELYSQSQFLYLELLMSQKEQILGRELHADSKANKVTDKDAFSGWSKKTQSWQDTKYEYWWDEIGYQIIDIEPGCKL